jgi:hypothetical protein
MIQKIKGNLEMETLRGGNMLHNLLINMLINLLAPPRVSETGNTFYLKQIIVFCIFLFSICKYQ